MISSLSAVPRVGAQRPRVEAVPAFVSSAGDEAVAFCDSIGLNLDPWQRHVLQGSLGERADGQWAAFEVGVVVPRQNGKGSLLEGRELAGLFLFEEQLILHSAHEFKTAQEAFRRVLAHIQTNPQLEKRVARVRTSHGEEGIELKSGARLRFVARSTGSGRGFTGDVVILDEAYNLSSDAMAALLPTLSARPNPQVWYTSSAGMATSDQLRAVRDRGVKGAGGRLAYFEWSAAPGARPDDPTAWAQANPALGIRITEEFVAAERDAMDEAGFARERLGVWDDPAAANRAIGEGAWRARSGAAGRPEGPVAFAVSASWPDAAWASIGVAGRRDGELLVQVVEHRRGTSWLLGRLKELVGRHEAVVVLDRKGPAGFLEAELIEAGITPEVPSMTEISQAFGMFVDEVRGDAPTLRHYDQPELTAAVLGAQRRPLGDAFTWARKDETDISPLEAVTLAVWGLAAVPSSVPMFAWA